MPTYQYKCPECGEAKEAFYSITVRPKPPACKSCDVDMVFERDVEKPTEVTQEEITGEFVFVCPECGLIREFNKQPNSIQECNDCNCYMDRVTKRPKSFTVGGRPYLKPIHSDSLALMPSVVEEHRELFPDIEIDSECRPVFENYRQHDNYLKKIGAVKAPQRIKPKGKRIS